MASCFVLTKYNQRLYSRNRKVKGEAAKEFIDMLRHRRKCYQIFRRRGRLQDAKYGFNLSIPDMISALHPALCTDEILRLIIERLDRKSCVRLARTCKAVHEAALDAIWHDIPSVEPLFSLFPPTCMLGNRPYEAMVRRVRGSCSLSRLEMTPTVGLFTVSYPIRLDTLPALCAQGCDHPLE